MERLCTYVQSTHILSRLDYPILVSLGQELVERLTILPTAEKYLSDQLYGKEVEVNADQNSCPQRNALRNRGLQPVLVQD